MPTNMIDYLRIALYVALIFIFILLFQAWDKDHAKPAPPVTTTTAANNYVPPLQEIHTTPAKITQSKEASDYTTVTPAKMIHVTTPLAEVVIDPRGGNIVQVKLMQYPESLHSNAPFLLLNNETATRYIAQSGLLSTEGPDTSAGQALYTTEKTDYVLTPGQKQLQVNLVWENSQGVKFDKIFTFNADSYEIGINYEIDNQSKQSWEGNLYLQLMRKNTPPANTQGFVNFATYFGAAISSPDKPFTKVSFKEMDSKNISQTIKDGWAAMIQHYFVSAWVPGKNTTSQYFSRVTNDGLYTIGIIGEKLVVTPGEKLATHASFYAGPTIADQLKKVAPGLNLTIDYGWLWMISAAIFWMMQKIYNLIGNWGWSIVIVTLIIKLAFYHLSAKSYSSMSALKTLQPKINALKERFGEDKQKFTQATLELYRKEKVNPMSGCLPILVQIPVFIALYWVLIESVELRQAPFIFWIKDLSVKDPYYVLPVLMGLSMFLQQRLNPPPPDPMQAKIMMLMPILFTIMFVNFPAGLMLYWFVNNTVSFLQQWYIMHSMTKKEKKHRHSFSDEKKR